MSFSSRMMGIIAGCLAMAIFHGCMTPGPQKDKTSAWTHKPESIAEILKPVNNVCVCASQKEKGNKGASDEILSSFYNNFRVKGVGLFHLSKENVDEALTIGLWNYTHQPSYGVDGKPYVVPYKTPAKEVCQAVIKIPFSFKPACATYMSLTPGSAGKKGLCLGGELSGQLLLYVDNSMVYDNSFYVNLPAPSSTKSTVSHMDLVLEGSGFIALTKYLEAEFIKARGGNSSK